MDHLAIFSYQVYESLCSLWTGGNGERMGRLVIYTFLVSQEQKVEIGFTTELHFLIY